LAKKLEYPERFVGMHFFNPVNRMPLVEVIAGEKTDEDTIATVVKLSKKMGKTPIKVKESAGFLVNRILLPYLSEATLMFEEGESIERIDETLVKFGMPMGPLSLIDEVGVDVGEKVSNILHQAYGNRMPSSSVLSKMIDNEWLGRKNGMGFYDYSSKKTTVNQKILALQKEQKSLDENTLLDRAMLIMINEASRCLEEKVVDNARYLDMAMVMGIGFPAFRGGLLKYADARSIANVVHGLQELQDIYGDRFEPSKLLLNMERNNKKFYDGGVS
jgi:3-hydroxyacyl-CoA dehydrogenase/enoyl-CoA hydratase/3-hydroxybutyryl-CoA epimerase